MRDVEGERGIPVVRLDLSSSTAHSAPHFNL